MEETKTTVASKDEIAGREKLAEANDIVRNRVYWSMGAGLVPIPIIDMAALLAIQLEMVSKLAKLYDQPFRRDLAKSAVVALLGSVIPTLAAGPMASLLKIIPVIGYTTGAVSMSL